MSFLAYEEFDLTLDEVELVIEGHKIYTTFRGVVTFDCRRRVKSIERYDDNDKLVMVCPHQSPALHKALLAAAATRDDEMREIINEYEHAHGLVEDPYPRMMQREFI